MEIMPVREGDVIAGKFRVERMLGEGGMGMVVCAQHLELEQRVAVKFLLPEIARRPDAAERFRREARAAVKIKSEHVARVLYVGTANDVPYMVMEYLDGHDLGTELRSRSDLLPIAEAVGYLLEACEAVAEAHANGIVHRDLKPANLFLARRPDGTRLVKILDFGISKSVTAGGSIEDLSLTNTSALIGSPLYMSPEQMHSAKNVDARSDIWSLGAILYQLLTGRPPFVAESIPQLCSALLHDTPPPLRTFRTDVPPELEAVICRALEKDKNRRVANVGELALMLASFAPHARLHAERAARVLSVTNVEMPSPDATRLPSVSSESPTLGAASAISVQSHEITSDRSGPSNPKPVSDKTLASWGKTGDPVQLLASHPRPKRTYFLIAAGVAVAGALIVYGVIRTTARANPATPSAIAPVPDPPKLAASIATPPTSTETAVPSGSSESPSLSASAAASAPVSKHPTSTSTRPNAPAPKPSSKPGGASVPDFGGRR